MNDKTVVYICFTILGACGLLPWNIFITAFGYFHYKLRNVTMALETGNKSDLYVVLRKDHSHGGSEYSETFEVWFTSTASATALLGTLINVALSTRIGQTWRISIGHVLVVPCLIACAALALVDTDGFQDVFFYLTLALVNITSLASSGFIGGCTMGIAARFPPQIIQGALFGQALVGIGTAIASIVSQATTPDPPVNGFVYFVCAAVFTLVSGASYCIMMRTNYAKCIMTTGQPPSEVDSGNASFSERQLLDGDTDRLVPDEEVEEEEELDVTIDNFEKPHVGTVCKKIWYESLVMAIVFLTTLSVFPATASLVDSTYPNGKWAAYFTPVACFLLFSTSDALGRLAVNVVSWPHPNSPLHLIFAVCRIAFAVVIFFCNVEGRVHTSAFFLRDWQFGIAMIALGVSNGYLVTLASTNACKRVHRREMELTGSMIAAVSMVSVMLGSGIAMGVIGAL